MTARELHVFRYVPGESPVHRMWAGTKAIAIVVLALVPLIKPSWITIGVITGVVVLTVAVSRVPAGAYPRPPAWLLAVIILPAPFYAIGSGLEGIERFGRATALGMLVFFVALIAGWTTPLAEVAPALATLLRPLRLVRLPVDDIALTVALSVRCLPLLLDEMRTLHAARRMRQPVLPSDAVQRVIYLHDLLVTALVSALRRARELADAMDARGGPGSATPSPVRVGWPDIVAAVVVAGAVAGIVVS